MPINLPNLITIGRIFAVPVTIWLIVNGSYQLAFIAFIAAGVSDAVDGYVAKRFGLQTELGAYLDPIADKLLLVGIFVSLGFLLLLPAWVVIVVVSRDVLIIGGMLLAWLLGRPIEVRPLVISKINTTLQIALAGLALGLLAFGMAGEKIIFAASLIVGLSTIASGAAYTRAWLEHMSNGNSAKKADKQLHGNGIADKTKSD